jgi:manganese/iron transport system permease protein
MRLILRKQRQAGWLITPGAIAFLVVRSFGQMLDVSVAVCLIAMFSCTCANFYS